VIAHGTVAAGGHHRAVLQKAKLIFLSSVLRRIKQLSVETALNLVKVNQSRICHHFRLDLNQVMPYFFPVL
jgi:hypothetical protein